MLYHKSLNLRAGEGVKIILGETIRLNETHIRIDLESAPPKTLIFAASKPENGDKSVIRHIRADKVRSEFDFQCKGDDLPDYSELHVSVPEDTQFHIGIYLRR
jgi:hypothetical protein